MTATGRSGRLFWIRRTRSMPLPSGRRMSVRQTSKAFSSSNSLAFSSVPASTQRMFMRPSVMEIRLRISGSSSTTSASLGMGLGPFVEGDPEHGAVAVVLVGQLCVISFAQFPRDIQTEPGAEAAGGEERLEELAAVLFGDAGAVVDDLERGCGVAAAGAAFETDQFSVLTLSVRDGVLAQVGEHLPEVPGVHVHDRRLARDGDGFDGQAVFGDEVPAKTCQPVGEFQRLGV